MIKSISYRHLLLALPLSLLAVACCRNSCCDRMVVCETYVHPYGLEMSESEWCRQGACGDVITTRKDGVTINRSYANGELNGQATYTFPYRQTIETIETYGSGRLVKITHYFSSGVVREESEHITPNERITKVNYDQGSPQSIEHFLGDKLMKGSYYNLKEVVESSVDEYSGKSTRRDIYGQLLSVDTVEDGVVVSSTTYHPNGMPEAITPFQDGIVHGQRKTFLPGGEPYTVEEWADGLQNGTTFVYQNGEKVTEIPYVNGAKTGVERHFRNDEEVVEEISWANDVQHGPTKRYVDGKVITDWYFNNAQVSKPVYDNRCNLLQ